MSGEVEVLELGRRWVDAESRGDADGLAGLLAHDFVLVGLLGFVLDKQQYLGSRRSGDLKHSSFTCGDVQVRMCADAAVPISSQAQQSTYQGHDASGRFRVTHIAVRLDGR